MSSVLIVEDSKMIGETLKKKIESSLNLHVDWVENYYDAVNIVSECSIPYFAAVADLNIPGAPDGEILDFLVHNSIPPIVFTGSENQTSFPASAARSFVFWLTTLTVKMPLTFLKRSERLLNN